MRKLRTLAFAVMLATGLFGAQSQERVSAFWCSYNYFNYGFTFQDCGPYGGEYASCGWVGIDCLALCYYVGGSASFDCTPTLVDEESDTWTASGTCTCSL
jgi:hypothetical protein